MKRVAILQARTTSSRLPGKVLMDLCGQSMLVQELRRLKRCRQVDTLVVATSGNSADDPIIDIAESEGIRWFRGSETDVLGRYIGAAREAKADVVIRVTADCPLIDPEESDRVIIQLLAKSSKSDYASNVIQRTYPRGLDTEAMFIDTLERVNRLAHSPSAREHVTSYILQEHPDLFQLQSVIDEEDNSDLRWTVDLPEDITLVRRLYEELEIGERCTPYREIVAHVRANPDLAVINQEIASKTAR